MHKICEPSAHCWGKKTHFSQQAFYIQNCSFHTARRKTIDIQQSGMQLTHTRSESCIVISSCESNQGQNCVYIKKLLFPQPHVQPGQGPLTVRTACLSVLQSLNELRAMLNGRRQGGIVDHTGFYLYCNTCFCQALGELENNFWSYSLQSAAYENL